MNKSLAICALCALTVICGSNPAFSAGEKKVDIAASPAGGTWFVGLGAYAKALSSMYPEFDPTLFPGGGVGNPVRVSRGQSAIGITANSLMKAAEAGEDPYKKPVKNIKALGNIDDITRVTLTRGRMNTAAAWKTAFASPEGSSRQSAGK